MAGKIKLTPSEVEVLCLLDEYERGTWRDLLVFFPRSSRSLTRALSSLVEKGLVEKEQLPGPGRKKGGYYKLTEEGEKVVERLLRREKRLFIHGMRELMRKVVVKQLVEDARKLLKRGRMDEARSVINKALAEVLLYPALYAYFNSEDEEGFEKMYREFLRISQAAIWTAGWAIADLIDENKEFFKEIYEEIFGELEKAI